MESRSRSLLAAAALALGLVFAQAKPAFAQNAKVEAAAKALQKKAMEEDYLATEFPKAKEKLEKAIAACGSDKCAPGVRALLQRDLGVVYIGGLNDKDKGQAAFAEAIKLDPAIALDKDLSTKEITAAFEAAKKGGAAPAPGPGPATPSKGPSGDFTHTPVPEQHVRTPVPVYAEYGGEEKIVKVVVRYKGFGMTEYKQFELKKVGEKGWGGISPCLDVQTGDFLYYIQGFNDQNDPVATAGSRNEPYKVAIKSQPVAEPPHLPGAQAPTQCADTGDCPPDFPGCHAKKPPNGDEPTGKPEGEACLDDNECQSNTCQKEKGADPLDKGVCTAPGGKKATYRKIWVGAQFGFDFAFVPSGDDVCKLHPLNPQDPIKDPIPVSDTGYYCYDSGASRDYPIRATNAAERAENDRVEYPSKNDKVQGGAAPATIRLLASFDYGVTPNILVGARVGLVVNTYAGTEGHTDGKGFSAPLHLEARGTYLFGKGLEKDSGVVPYVFIGGGISNWDAKVGVTVTEIDPATAKKTLKAIDAWYLGGPGFIGFGGGVRINVAQRVAIPLGLRAAFALGNGVLPSVSPELGVQFGF